MTEKEKMTAPIASVGADVEQPSSNKLTNQIVGVLLVKKISPDTGRKRGRIRPK